MRDPEPEDESDVRRRQVVEAAARVLAEDGPHGLSLRRIAADAGGSTQIVYTLFGGKPGLADALYGEGFRRLSSAMTAALDAAPPPGDPERLMALGRAYLAFAAAEPAFFAVMFSRAIAGFTPTRDTRAYGRSCTFGLVVAEAQRCLDAGTLTGGSADDLARICWATGHGVASLEAAGMLHAEDRDAFVERALATPLIAHRP
ncbi:MAG: TetR/AcrR family transcriptional regulator [Mycobacteriales bacterium]